MNFQTLLFSQEIKTKIRNTKLIVCDVDGVLTNGQIGYGNNINDFKLFNVKDGLATKMFQEKDINISFKPICLG